MQAPQAFEPSGINPVTPIVTKQSLQATASDRVFPKGGPMSVFSHYFLPFKRVTEISLEKCWLFPRHGVRDCFPVTALNAELGNPRKVPFPMQNTIDMARSAFW